MDSASDASSSSSSPFPSALVASLFLGLSFFDFWVRLEASLSQSLAPWREEVGYDGPWACGLTCAVVVVGATVVVTGCGVIPVEDSRALHFWPGDFLRREISILVEKTETLEVEGSMGAKSGSRVKSYSAPEGRGNWRDVYELN